MLKSHGNYLIEFFVLKPKLSDLAILCKFALYNFEKNVTPSGNRTRASHRIWFQIQHYPFYTNLTFACKTETSGFLYSHALLIPLKLSKSKFQVVHEQKFKDLLSSTCQVSVERTVLDLESEVMKGQVLFPMEVTSFSKFYNPNLHIIARSDSLGFKTENPNDTILEIFGLKTPRDINDTTISHENSLMIQHQRDLT